MPDPLIEHLKIYSELKDSIAVERFEATLGQIAQLNDPRYIVPLLGFFRDDCEYHEVMFSIIHTIERFDAETYAREILKGLPGFWKNSPYWAKIIHFRIFNDPSSFKAYKTQLSDVDLQVRASVRELLSTMRKHEPKFFKHCDSLLALL
jgi:hypothetical protein